MGHPQKQWLDEREYLAREAAVAERHEYVGGVAYAMAGASEHDNRIAGNLFAALRAAARASPSTAAIDMREKLQACWVIESLRYCVTTCWCIPSGSR